MILAIVAVYAVCAVISARMVAGHLAWKWKSQFVESPEMLDWITAGSLGLVAGLLWPAVLVRAGVGRVSLPALGAERTARERDREGELEKAREHLAELERETGLS